MGTQITLEHTPSFSEAIEYAGKQGIKQAIAKHGKEVAIRVMYGKKEIGKLFVVDILKEVYYANHA